MTGLNQQNAVGIPDLLSPGLQGSGNFCFRMSGVLRVGTQPPCHEKPKPQGQGLRGRALWCSVSILADHPFYSQHQLPAIREGQLGCSTPVHAPDNCSPGQHHVEQKSCPANPRQPRDSCGTLNGGGCFEPVSFGVICSRARDKTKATRAKL